MKFAQSIHISAAPADVFATYEKVSAWPKWDPETEAAAIDGDFVVGTTGTIKPKGAPQSKIKLLEVTRNKSFTVECGLPLCKMQFVHLMEPDATGTALINEVNFSGLLAPLFGRLIGKSIDQSLPDSLLGLKKYIEAGN